MRGHRSRDIRERARRQKIVVTRKHDVVAARELDELPEVAIVSEVLLVLEIADLARMRRLISLHDGANGITLGRSVLGNDDFEVCVLRQNAVQQRPRQFARLYEGMETEISTSRVSLEVRSC